MVMKMEAIEIPRRIKTDIGTAKYSTVNKKYYLRYHGKMMYLHKAVYLECYGGVPEGYEIHHIDGNHFNNKANNLIAIPSELHTEIHRIPNPRYDVEVVDKIKREVVLEFRTTPLREDFLKKVGELL